MDDTTTRFFIDGQRHDSPLSYRDQAFYLQAEGGQEYGLPLHSAALSVGGTRDRYIVWTGAAESGEKMVVYTDGPWLRGIYDLLPMPEQERLKPFLNKQSRSGFLRHAINATLITLIIGVPIAFVMSRTLIADGIVAGIPTSWEVEAGRQVADSLLSKGEMRDKQVRHAVHVISSRLLRGVGKQPYKFRFHVVETDQVNALAAPGGEVVIFSGLLNKAESPEEVAGVLAHEIQHCLQRHSLRGLVLKVGTFGLLYYGLGGGAVSESLTMTSANLLSLKFGRDDETEADDLGFELLVKAKIDPRGMISFFKKLSEQDIGIEKALSFASTHPATGDRIQRLQAKYDALPEDVKKSFKPLEVDWPALRKRLSK